MHHPIIPRYDIDTLAVFARQLIPGDHDLSTDDSPALRLTKVMVQTGILSHHDACDGSEVGKQARATALEIFCDLYGIGSSERVLILTGGEPDPKLMLWIEAIALNPRHCRMIVGIVAH